MRKMLVALAVCAALTIGCKDREACERSRMDVAKIWGEVKASAARRKATPPEESAVRANVGTWTEIENEADTLETSFQTTQVTWNAAEKSRQEVRQKLADVANANDMGYKSFERLFAEANQKTDKFSELCR